MSSLPSTSMKLVSRLTVAALVLGTAQANAQQPGTTQAAATITLSLDDALRLVQTASQTIEVARAGVVRATGGRLQARSQYLPQLNATAGYTKTLKSQFSSFGGGGASPAPDTTTIATRAATRQRPESHPAAERVRGSAGTCT